VRAASHRSNQRCVTHGGGRRCVAEGCDGVPLQGRRICAECFQKWLDEKIKQVTEERIAAEAAEAAAAAQLTEERIAREAAEAAAGGSGQ
jgi:hypothetical protein